MSSKEFKDHLERHKAKIIASSQYTGRQPRKSVIEKVATCNAKHSYASRELAKEKGFRVYKCDLCFGWHRSSLPSENSLTHQINKLVKQKEKE